MTRGHHAQTSESAPRSGSQTASIKTRFFSSWVCGALMVAALAPTSYSASNRRSEKRSNSDAYYRGFSALSVAVEEELPGEKQDEKQDAPQIEFTDVATADLTPIPPRTVLRNLHANPRLMARRKPAEQNILPQTRANANPVTQVSTQTKRVHTRTRRSSRSESIDTSTSVRVSELKNVKPVATPNPSLALRSLENLEPARRARRKALPKSVESEATMTTTTIRTVRSSSMLGETPKASEAATISRKTTNKNSNLRYYRIHR